MTKYRIVKFEDSTGHIWYQVEKRVWFVFWRTELQAVGRENYIPRVFNTFGGALAFVMSQLHIDKKDIKKEVINY